jgi:hypothetical protein
LRKTLEEKPMGTVAAILALIPSAIQVVGGVESLAALVANLHAGGVLSADEVQQIRDDGGLADANLDAAIAAAKQRQGA